MVIRRLAEPEFDPDEDRMDPKESKLVEDAVKYIANLGLSNDIDMPNFLACVSISLLTTLAINEGMDMDEIKALFKKMRKEAQSSAKKFYDGRVIERGIIEDPRENGKPNQGE